MEKTVVWFTPENGRYIDIMRRLSQDLTVNELVNQSLDAKREADKDKLDAIAELVSKSLGVDISAEYNIENVEHYNFFAKRENMVKFLNKYFDERQLSEEMSLEEFFWRINVAKTNGKGKGGNWIGASAYRGIIQALGGDCR